MPKRIPIARAKEVGARHPDVRRVIILAWDGERQHVVTWGKSTEDCSAAAHAGNVIKSDLGWSDELCRDDPARVRGLKAALEELLEELPRHGVARHPEVRNLIRKAREALAVAKGETP